MGAADDAGPASGERDRAVLVGARLREILDDMQLAALFLDTRGIVVYCNRYLVELHVVKDLA